MKQLLITLASCYCIIFNLAAQNYVAEYKFVGPSENSKGSLVFNANEWRYDATELMKISVTSDNANVTEESSSGTKSVSTFNYRSLYKNEYLDEELLYNGSSKCIIRGKLEKPEWKILSDSVKMIDNYTCLMAKGFVRGRNYTIWFTPDIPVSAGPWKLWGLPGLIMIAKSDDSVVGITLLSLKQTVLAPKKPTAAKTVTPEEFKSQFNEAIKRMTRKLQGLSVDRNTDINVTNIKINHPDKTLVE